MLTPTICQEARLSRDKRFDGRFFVAVKTTGIYCRSICPANPPLEKNVLYVSHAIEAANLGFRPCLRCRPDSAPGSPAWQGTHTTFNRAITLIKEGALQDALLKDLTERLGISERYLRQLFHKYLGTSPKNYALYQQGLFAKQLLHQTTLPISQIALASGFGSIRRFNDYFQTQLQLTPSAIRKQKRVPSSKLALHLAYRPPYNWTRMHDFLESRLIPDIEWCDTHSYGRTFQLSSCRGYFNATHIEESCKFIVEIELDDIKQLQLVVSNIRRILDLDADMETIEQSLQQVLPDTKFISGLRLPGTWDVFEAGIRAILGQQIAVGAARKLVTRLTRELGENVTIANQPRKYFPTPVFIAKCRFDFFKIPESRKQTLRNLAEFYVDNLLESDLSGHRNTNSPDQWLSLKGIGHWTINYAKMRGNSDPNIYLEGDVGVKNSVKQNQLVFTPEHASPWQSYLTLQLWNQINGIK